MPSQARKDIVREGEVGTYHTWSRCVRQAYLLDHRDGDDDRRAIVQQLIFYMAGVFSVDLCNYTILTNHFHLLLRIRPDLVEFLSDEEVAWRWKRAWPRWTDNEWIREPTDQEIDELLCNPIKLAAARKNLGSLSWFMARVKEPIAKLFNHREERTGHFFEQRFGSRELVDDAGVFACSAYLDLNQITAGASNTLIHSDYSAIQDRIRTFLGQEAEDSLTQFRKQNRKRSDLELEVQQLESLFTEGVLSPISADGPLLLVSESDAQPVSCGQSKTEQRQEKPEQNAESNQLEPHDKVVGRTETNATTPSSHTLPMKTYNIHEYHSATVAARASDSLFLNMPFEQYYNIVERLAQQRIVTMGRPPDNVDDPVHFSPSEVGLLSNLGLLADRLSHTVEHFQTLFGSVVGTQGQVKGSHYANSKQRIRGFSNCRKAFT